MSVYLEFLLRSPHSDRSSAGIKRDQTRWSDSL